VGKVKVGARVIVSLPAKPAMTIAVNGWVKTCELETLLSVTVTVGPVLPLGRYKG
jgi:hypothetical protein